MSTDLNPLAVRSCFRCPIHADIFSAPLEVNAFPDISELNRGYFSPILNTFYLPLSSYMFFGTYAIAQTEMTGQAVLDFTIVHEQIHLQRNKDLLPEALRGIAMAAWLSLVQLMHHDNELAWVTLLRCNNIIIKMIECIELAEEVLTNVLTLAHMSKEKLATASILSQMREAILLSMSDTKNFGPKFREYYEKMERIHSHFGEIPLNILLRYSQRPFHIKTSLYPHLLDLVVNEGMEESVILLEKGLNLLSSLPSDTKYTTVEDWITFFGRWLWDFKKWEDELGLISRTLESNVDEYRKMFSQIYPTLSTNLVDVVNMLANTKIVLTKVNEHNYPKLALEVFRNPPPDRLNKLEKREELKKGVLETTANNNLLILLTLEGMSLVSLPMPIENKNMATPVYRILPSPPFFNINNQLYAAFINDIGTQLSNIVFLEGLRQMVAHENGLICPLSRGLGPWPVDKVPCCGLSQRLLKLWESHTKAHERGVIHFKWLPPCSLNTHNCPLGLS